MPEMTRRQFVTQASLLAALGSRGVAYASDPIGRTRPSHLKLSLAAYSYRDYLSGPKKTTDLFGFLELAADLGLDAVEPTSYYFPEDVNTDYLHRLKQQAFLLGLQMHLVGVAVGEVARPFQVHRRREAPVLDEDEL